MREYARLGSLLALLIVVALVLGLISDRTSSNSTPSSNAVLSHPATTTPPTAAQLQQLQQEPAFQYLISYTKEGFVPQTLTIKKGQTVRFTNNSTQEMWVASLGQGTSPVYPGNSQCGGSAFDSCQPIVPGGWWEFTFNESGVWKFVDNLDRPYTGTITVL